MAGVLRDNGEYCSPLEREFFRSYVPQIIS